MPPRAYAWDATRRRTALRPRRCATQSRNNACNAKRTPIARLRHLAVSHRAMYVCNVHRMRTVGVQPRFATRRSFVAVPVARPTVSVPPRHPSATRRSRRACNVLRTAIARRRQPPRCAKHAAAASHVPPILTVQHRRRFATHVATHPTVFNASETKIVRRVHRNATTTRASREETAASRGA